MEEMTLEMPTGLREQLSVRARAEGLPLNQFIIHSLTQLMSNDEYTVYVLPPEEIAKQEERYKALLERLGPPATYEEARRILDERPLAPPEKRVSPERLRRFNEKLEAARANRQKN